MRKYSDLTIIGAGPAGLFAAYQLSRLSPKTQVLVLGGLTSRSSLPKILKRSQANPVKGDGLGGSGIFADKLYFEPAGGWLEKRSPEYAEALIAYVAEIFERFGGLSERKAFALDPKIPKFPGLTYKPYKRLVALTFADYKKFLENILAKMRENHVDVKLGPFVKTISKNPKGFVLTLDDGSLLRSRNVLIATGRSSVSWFKRQAANLGLPLRARVPYFGIRIEGNSMGLRKLKQWGHDPKLRASSSDTKTHCVCFGGHVISCTCDNMTLIDGTTLDKPSNNTSLSVLTCIPSELGAEKARRLVQDILKAGKGQPLVQTMGDFMSGIPSSWRRIRLSSVNGTLKRVTPGEINHLLPAKVVENVGWFLEQMEDTLPGITNPDNLVYAPVFEWFSPIVSIRETTGKTSVKGLFVAGDVAGLSQGVVMAAASGLWTGIKLANLI